ncbi:hypothetical protein KGQ19_27365 [Catenulispora sp. NL8]|uniref:Uncharacterized protein n=1 Tax=Catenulispora pinistramenti TaxID=2705254 RepID=A0ABS5KX06_9ACTN|nr:hypothetical protein [Catenulispora pinistramenti]MBS2550597.1 hypothetical protein [Catenulispora pinistramenti]
MADTTMTPSADPKAPHYMVRLAFRARPDTVSHLGYLFPAAYFGSGEHAERFGMCLWATRHRNVVALHVYPPGQRPHPGPRRLVHRRADPRGLRHRPPPRARDRGGTRRDDVVAGGFASGERTRQRP